MVAAAVAAVVVVLPGLLLRALQLVAMAVNMVVAAAVLVTLAPRPGSRILSVSVAMA